MTTKVRKVVIVRPAVEADVPALGEMTGEFQDYLNTLDEPGEPAALTTEALRRDGFGDNPWFSAILAEDAGTPTGYLLYHFGYWPDNAARTMVVADLFVRKAARGQGVGTALMAEATRILRQRGGNMIQWTVWNRNPAALSFYRRLGATPAHDETLMMWPNTAWPAT